VIKLTRFLIFLSKEKLRHPCNEKVTIMKRVLYITVLVSFFIGTSVFTSIAASEQESHHPSGAQAAASTSSDGMMMQQGAGMNLRYLLGEMPKRSFRSIPKPTSLR